MNTLESDILFTIAAAGDIHDGKAGKHQLFVETMEQIIADNPDIILLCGDITENGTEKQARAVALVIKQTTIPVAVLPGNHDHWGENALKVMQILHDEGGAIILNGDVFTLEKNGKTLAVGGSEGYEGKSDKNWATSFHDMHAAGQSSIIEDETKKLENVLAKLKGDRNIVMLHYAPGDNEQMGTLLGEKLEIHPYLGSRRLGDAVDRHNKQHPQYPVSYIFHGHADAGSAEGHTPGGVDVFNVSLIAAERRTQPSSQRRLYRLIQIR